MKLTSADNRLYILVLCIIFNTERSEIIGFQFNGCDTVVFPCKKKLFRSTLFYLLSCSKLCFTLNLMKTDNRITKQH